MFLVIAVVFVKTGLSNGNTLTNRFGKRAQAISRLTACAAQVCCQSEIKPCKGNVSTAQNTRHQNTLSLFFYCDVIF